MRQATLSTPSWTEVQERYRDNFARHLMGIDLYLQSEVMNRLVNDCGHRGLRINFEPYITIIGRHGARLSDIADLLEISRQAANQTANQIEAAGYIRREADPSDGRAKLLVATQRGAQLRRDGAREAAALQSQLRDIIGEKALQQCINTLSELNGCLGLLLPQQGESDLGRQAILGGLLPRLRDYVNNRLMHLTIERGHPGLKPSFGQVLTAIGPRGGRMQQMATTQGVSKQAINAIATELDGLGYLQRETDPRDARQVLLQFTPLGRQLISDSVASVDELRAEFAAIVGDQALDALCGQLARLYGALHLEEDIFGNLAAVDIRVLAAQLIEQLGEEGARALGRHLLSRS